MRFSTHLLAILLLQAAAFAGAGADLAADRPHNSPPLTPHVEQPATAARPAGESVDGNSRGPAISTRTYILPMIGAAELRQIKVEAQRGSAIAQFQLGDSFDKCDPKQYRKAVKWYAKAAAQGFAPAQNALALMYWAGRGVRRDDAVAFALFQKAADAGLTSAQHNLGLMYLEGDAVARDQAAGDAWLRVAADGGNHVSASVLEQIEPSLDATTRARARELATRINVRFQAQLALAQ